MWVSYNFKNDTLSIGSSGFSVGYSFRNNTISANYEFNVFGIKGSLGVQYSASNGDWSVNAKGGVWNLTASGSYNINQGRWNSADLIAQFVSTSTSSTISISHSWLHGGTTVAGSGKMGSMSFDTRGNYSAGFKLPGGNLTYGANANGDWGFAYSAGGVISASLNSGGLNVDVNETPIWAASGAGTGAFVGHMLLADRTAGEALGDFIGAAKGQPDARARVEGSIRKGMSFMGARDIELGW